MSPKLRGLRTRLALFYAGFLAAALFLFSAGVYLTVAIAEAKEDEPEAEKARELQAVRHHIFIALLAGVPVASGLAALGGTFMTRHTMRALGELVRAAGSVGPEQLHTRIHCAPDAEEEVQRLAAALNEMLGRIERAVKGLRRFTADAAHELRTPLAAIMGELERCLLRPRDPETLRAAMASALEGLGQVTRLLDALLTLARSDAGAIRAHRTRVDLHALLLQVTGPYQGLAEDRTLRVCLHEEEAIELETDPLLLGRAVANLLDNACKFCGPESCIEVSSARRGPIIEIAIADNGPGLSQEDEARLFERFYRSARYRGSVEGFGLGLSLSREFVHTLGGRLTLANRECGGAIAIIQLMNPATKDTAFMKS